ncbi:uncharacterized protein METZ01_LOCUS509535, partial [marine metagenome]
LTANDYHGTVVSRMRYTAYLIILLVLGTGCQSGNLGKSTKKDKKGGVRNRSKDKEEFEYGLKYYEGVGWRYIKPGTDVAVLTYNNTQLLEYTRKAMKEERYGDAKFAAGYFIQRTPGADDVPEMRRVIAEIY